MHAVTDNMMLNHAKFTGPLVGVATKKFEQPTQRILSIFAQFFAMNLFFAIDFLALGSFIQDL